jgi:hypothetical protein
LPTVSCKLLRLLRASSRSSMDVLGTASGNAL